MMNTHVIRMIIMVSLALGLAGPDHAFPETCCEKNPQHKSMQHLSSKSRQETVASIEIEPEHLSVGTPATIVFSIRDRQGRPITDLTVHHDRLIHVVITSQDFSIFAHIHPEDFGPVTPQMKKNARYPLKFTFLKAGRYIIGIDFAVKGQPVSKHFVIHVDGEPLMGQPKEDLGKEKQFGGLDVKLSSMPDHIIAGEEVTLSYLFGKGGKAVTNLEPYLSGPMNLAIISSDLTHFIHIPEMPAMEHHHMKMDMRVPDKFGPEVDVHVVFPSKGLYQIFGQVAYQGEVIATSFMVKVD
jgi:hypothetical protein